MTDFTENAAQLVELAADLGKGDFDEMMSLLARAAATATMIPFNKAETLEAWTARIVNRNDGEQERIDAALDKFVADYRRAACLVRDMPIWTFPDLAMMPPAGEA